MSDGACVRRREHWKQGKSGDKNGPGGGYRLPASAQLRNFRRLE